MFLGDEKLHIAWCMSSFEEIFHGIDTIVGREVLEKKLNSGKKLRVKLGIDPTRPDLHFGHLVVLNKLRQFQELGHDAILLIGDFTTTIGDPSGRSCERPMLSKEEIEQNYKTYLDQAFKILDPEKTIVRKNSEWFGNMTFADAILLARNMTVAQMLERDDFSKRYASNTPISIVEFLYPLLQGHDSVVLNADVELGGRDQLFNLLVGRNLQKMIGQDEQTIITMPLLVGLDGVRKMSKSYDNYVAFNDSLKDMFGKIMSISDDTMWVYYRYLIGMSDDEISDMKNMHPMECKKQLAVKLCTKFFGHEQSQSERERFEQVFSKKELPDDMPVFKMSELIGSHESKLVDALYATQLIASKKEIRRLIEQGAVKVNSERVHDDCIINVTDSDVVVQAGKRTFVRFVM